MGKRRKNEGNWQEGRRPREGKEEKMAGHAAPCKKGNWQEGRGPREGKEEKNSRSWRLGQRWGSRPWA